MPYRQNFPIPSVINPPKTCLQIEIPDNPDWKRVIAGLLFELSYWFNWERTGDDSGAQCAAVWKQVYNSIDWSDMSCCCGDVVTIKRFDPITGRPQISTDDGLTWQDDPSDIKNQIQVLPPIVYEGGVKTKCDAATNGSEHVNELITATAENLEAASSVFGLAVAVAEAILALFLIIVSAGTLAAPVTAVATAIWAAATGLFNLGLSAYNAYWTTDKQDAILCIIYCHIGDNGQFTEEQYQAFRSDIYSTLPASPALDIIMTSINAGGARGLSQMCSYGNAALADCSSCNCEPGCANDFIVYPSSPNYFGIIVEQTPTYVIVKTDVINVNSLYYTYLVSDPPENCCVINHTQYFLETTDEELMTYDYLLANGAQQDIGGADCGSAIPGTIGPKTTDNCLNQVQMQNEVPFVVMYTKDSC